MRVGGRDVLEMFALIVAHHAAVLASISGQRGGCFGALLASEQTAPRAYVNDRILRGSLGLAVEEVGGGRHRVELEGLIGVELQFHYFSIRESSFPYCGSRHTSHLGRYRCRQARGLPHIQDERFIYISQPLTTQGLGEQSNTEVVPEE